MKLRLRSRLALWNLTLIAITAGSVDLFLNSSFRDDLEQQIEERLRREGVVASAYLDLARTRGEPIDDAADWLSERLEVRVTVVAQDGRVLGDSELDGEALEKVDNHAARPEIREAVERGVGKAIRFSSTTYSDYMYLAIRSTGSTIRLAMPLEEVDALVGELRSRLVYATLIALVLTLPLGYVVSIKISRPIREMAVGAKRLATGELDHRFPITGDDETAALGSAMNTMAENLSAQIRELSEGKQRLESILAAMDEGVMVLDRAGRISLTNPSVRQILGTQRDLIGRMPLEVFRHEGLDRAVRNVLAELEGTTIELTVRHRVVEVHLAPFTDSSGELQGAVVVLHDLTDIRRTERMRRDFVANVSHEFKTPLTSIRGYAETLLSGAEQDRKLREDFLRVIERNAQFLEALVTDLLALSQMESELPATKEQVDVRAVIDEQVAGRQALLDERGIRVIVDCLQAELQADRSRLATAMSNLVDNAINYNRPGGEVRISGRIEGDDFTIEVADTGYGIPADEVPRIFERFYRVDKARTRESGGTGLGLAIARHAIESQGGQITVESQLGRGSTFRIRMPNAFRGTTQNEMPSPSGRGCPKGG